MSGLEVAVIGGGPLGLMALKNFREDGFDATLYESRSWVGGLWKYSEDDSLSTAEHTIFNSSKYRTAVSDFPVPDEMDDFPTAPQLHKYFEDYCTHFDLWPHIKLSSPVKKVRRDGKRWAVEIGEEGQNVRIEHFDKVALSCGPFITPKKPDFEGIDRFEGEAMHAINFHNPARFKDRRVLVVGAHASSQDVITTLSKHHASKAYLSHRSGVLLIPRYGTDGSVYDRMPPLGFTILTMYISAWFPTAFTWIMDTLVGSMAKKGFANPPASLGSLATTKAPSIAVAPPLIASEIYQHFRSGFCEGVPEVRRITGPRTVELKDGRKLEDVDAIVYCTGYHASIPVDMEPSDLNPYPYPGAVPNLYRNTFPLHPDANVRNSLAFLGQGAVAVPGFAPHEAISMCVSQIWKGTSSLPSLAGMQKWRQDYLKWREDMTKQYNAQSTFYTLFLPAADHLAWVDACAGLGMRQYFGLGSRWTNAQAWTFWWNDRKLYNICLTGLTSPAIFRLFDQGKRKAWSGAREQIFIDNGRVKKQQEVRLKAMKKEE